MTTQQATPRWQERGLQWGPRWFTHLGRGRNGTEYDPAVRFPHCDSQHTGCTHRVVALPVTSGLMDHLRFAPAARVAGGIEPRTESDDRWTYGRARDEHRTREAIKRAAKAADDYVWKQDERARDRAERRQPAKPITRLPQPTPVCAVSSCKFISTKEVAGAGGLRYCAPHARWMDDAIQRVHDERDRKRNNAAYLKEREVANGRRREERERQERYDFLRQSARDLAAIDAQVARREEKERLRREGESLLRALDPVVERDRLKRANYLLAHPEETLPPVVTCHLTGCDSKAVMTAGNVSEGQYCTRHGMLLKDTLAQVSWHRGGQA